MQHEHLRWKRLPEVAPRKLRRGFGQRAPLRLNLTEHANHLLTGTQTSLTEIKRQRSDIGVDPSRLLVLRLNFQDVSYRELLEDKLNLRIVYERETRRESESINYSIHIRFSREPDIERIKSNANQHGHQITIGPRRASDGSIDKLNFDILFQTKEAALAFIDDTGFHRELNFEVKDKKPIKHASSTTTEFLVQFSDAESISDFERELSNYKTSPHLRATLTDFQRRELFDSLESISFVTRNDRMGNRLKTEGIPLGNFYMDVDLWHPGSPLRVAESIQAFNTVVRAANGRVTDSPTGVADTLLLARVYGDSTVLEKLLKYDNVASIDLPPIIVGQQYTIFNHPSIAPTAHPLPDNAPLACIIDSGVISAQPLLAGHIVEERDFDSGEDTVVDTTGHGTYVGGIVVYGDIHTCLQSNNWTPKVRLLSAKIMRKSVLGGTEFADESRIETQVKRAITYYAVERHCRIFNISFGILSRPYTGGRQLPLAILLDELASALNIVIVVSAGNVSNPTIPAVRTSAEFQSAVLENLFTTEHSIIDPASAVNTLSVGSIARGDVPFSPTPNPGHRPPLVASPTDFPSPFTRTGLVASNGDGISRAIKPEFVGYGGNYCLNTSGHVWDKMDPNLAEPSLNFNFQTSRLLSVNCGTSAAAPFVTHVCALVENKANQITAPGSIPGANLIRALTAHSAMVAENTRNRIHACFPTGLSESEKENRLLRLMGYGRPDIDRAIWSTDNRTVLFSEDALEEEHFHLYELEIPDNFIQNHGDKCIRVSLAYDPPVRGTRKEYLSRNMWFRLYRGLNSADVFAAMSRAAGTATPPKLPKRNEVQSRPTISTLKWSTIQNASFTAARQTPFEFRTATGQALWHILVGCSANFTTSPSASKQKYALVCSLEHSDNTVQIYQTIKLKLQQRVRIQH